MAKCYAFLVNRDIWNGYNKVKNAKEIIFTTRDEFIKLKEKEIKKDAIYHFSESFWVASETENDHYWIVPILFKSIFCSPLYDEQYKKWTKNNII